MDPITLILTALAAGALAGTQATASEAVSDAYRGLKVLIQRKFSNKEDATLALTKYEEKPEIWEAPLKDALIQSELGRDQEAITAAQNLMALISPQQAGMGKFNVQITGNVQGMVQGDKNSVTMSFGNETTGDRKS